jgi:uncharacterized spore protein YtfJ
MPDRSPLPPIARLLRRTLSIRHVYGEPVREGPTTIIPVAQVAFGLGGGGGRAIPGPREGAAATGGVPEAFGSGGGGGVRMTPVGVLEIGPRGVRFIRFRPLGRLLGAVGVGVALGWVLGRRRS